MKTEFNLEAFFSHFPSDAKSWAYATDEIRDLCHLVRTRYNGCVLNVLEEDEHAIGSLNFRTFSTPAQWNTEAKKQISELWPSLPADVKAEIADRFEFMFQTA